jgi:hypothetical protein
MKLKRWEMMIIRDFRIFIRFITPRIHNLPQVIYINWLGYEWFIEKRK